MSTGTVASIGGVLRNERGTESFGAALASCIAPGMRIYLSGGLGAGKTTLVRAVLRALGHTGRVKSPTFTLVEPYSVSRLYLYHCDFYRFNVPEELDDAGFRDCFDGTAVVLAEWPERAGDRLPAADLHVRLRVAGNAREVEITAGTPTGSECIARLRAWFLGDTNGAAAAPQAGS
jgi:tRNA threonylcarbamoyladenosine biosynthesis protein TsaE